MTLVGAVRRRHTSSGLGVTALWTVLVLVASVVVAVAIAVANKPYFDLVERVVGPIGGEELRALVFSSFLLLIGIPIIARRPSAFGFRIGTMRRDAGLVVAALAAGGLLTAAVLRLSGAVPYSDASLFVESVDVPITEELVFRGVLLTALLAVLGRWHEPRTATILAVLFDGAAFGLAHAANALALDPAFVAQQVLFAVVLGTACAALMVRTRSVYAAMLLHAVVNAVVVLA